MLIYYYSIIINYRCQIDIINFPPWIFNLINNISRQSIQIITISRVNFYQSLTDATIEKYIKVENGTENIFSSATYYVNFLRYRITRKKKKRDTTRYKINICICYKINMKLILKNLIKICSNINFNLIFKLKLKFPINQNRFSKNRKLLY